MDIQTVEQNISLFRGMIRCNTPVDLWCFDGEDHLLDTNCPHRDPFLRVMEVFGCRETMFTHGREQGTPMWLTTPLGVSWAVAFHRESGVLLRVYAMGPTLNAEVSFQSIRKALSGIEALNPGGELQSLVTALEQVPVVPTLVITQLALMLHYAVTGEELHISDIHVPHSQVLLTTGEVTTKDRHRTWMAEQNMLRMVQEGDLNYRDALNAVGTLSGGVPIRTGDVLRQAKDSVIVSISLCVRAAIRGGLSPDTAYSLGDSYIQNVEEARTMGDVGAIHGIMFDDFVQRVHRGRTDPGVSVNIRRCCDYIETHTEEELSIAELARMVGYTEYYLSRKFREETQIGLNDYIKIARMERAKFLLTGTDDSIQTIADRLHFCSVSHFGATFRKLVGCSPKEYREQTGRG